MERVVEGGRVRGPVVAHEVDPADGPGEERVAGEDHVRVVALVQDVREGLGRVPGGLERGEGERAELEPVAVADRLAVREVEAGAVADRGAGPAGELGRADQVVLVPVRLVDPGDGRLVGGRPLEVDPAVAAGVDHGGHAVAADEVGLVGEPL